jgi:hypothetical protein
MPPDGPTPELRASDADREATAERLHAAALEGRLDAAELEERMSAAYAARWCSELAQLTADVTPPPAGGAGGAGGRPPDVRPVVPADERPGDRLAGRRLPVDLVDRLAAGGRLRPRGA